MGVVGLSVFGLRHAFERTGGSGVAFEILARWLGVLVQSSADPTGAHFELGWRVEDSGTGRWGKAGAWHHLFGYPG